MGRWAQRRIRGGGTNPAATLIEISTAASDDDSIVIATYTGSIDATNFANGDFTSQPSGAASVAILQDSPNSLEIDFNPATITGDTFIQYSGTTPGVLTPQTVLY
jgi:hypothetical protein